MNAVCCVGITEPQPGRLMVTVDSQSADGLRTQSFHVEELPAPRARQLFTQGSFPSGVIELSEFIRANAEQSSTLHVLMETPSLSLRIGAPHLQVLMCLARITRRLFRLQGEFQEDTVLLREMAGETRLHAYSGDRIMYLPVGTSAAYGTFMLGEAPTSHASSLFAALIAQHLSLFDFLHAQGEVQSSQDIVVWMRDQASEMPTSVITDDVIITTASCSQTKYDRLDRIPLEYAVAQQAHRALGSVLAWKFALLGVCKKWGIRLYCKLIAEGDSEATGNVEQAALDDSDDDFFDLRDEWLVFDPAATLPARTQQLARRLRDRSSLDW